jgi:hypothetical protein
MTSPHTLRRTPLRHRLLTEARERRLNWYIGLNYNITRGITFLVKSEKTQSNVLRDQLMFAYPHGQMGTTTLLRLSDFGTKTLRAWDAEYGCIELEGSDDTSQTSSQDRA